MACRLLVKKAAASFMKKILAPYRGYYATGTTTMACGMWAASPISSPYRGERLHYTTTGTVCGLWKKKAPSSYMKISAPYRGYSTGMMMVWWMWAVAAASCMKNFSAYRGRTIARLTVEGSFKIRHHAHAHARFLGLSLNEKIFFSFSCDLDVEYADIHKWAGIHFKTHGNLLTITIKDHRGDVLRIIEVNISQEEDAKH